MDTTKDLPFWLAIMALAEQATHDPLTGLYNRRYFDATLRDHVEAAYRYGRDLSLVLFDIDGFKGINDRLGHPEGDRILVRFAGLLRSSSRKADIVCRCGGDEFAVIMPETGADAAASFVQRFQAEADSPSATAGLASLAKAPDTGNDWTDLVARADANLLARKGSRGS